MSFAMVGSVERIFGAPGDMLGALVGLLWVP